MRKPKQDLQFDEHLIKNAEVFERHQQLGHFRVIDGYKIACELRNHAATIRTVQADENSSTDE